MRFSSARRDQLSPYLRKLLLALVAVLPIAVNATLSRQLLSETDHKYATGDSINLYANKVGPFHNPRCAAERAAAMARALPALPRFRQVNSCCPYDDFESV
jgi:hypothetical protein